MKPIEFLRKLKNPFFYYGAIAMLLLFFMCVGSEDITKFNDSLKDKSVIFNSFLKDLKTTSKDSLFLSPNSALALETPDLKIIDDNCVCGISSYRVLSPQVLGAMYGEDSQNANQVTEYAVLPGDTYDSIAQNFGITVNTILWSNNLSKGSTLKVGQTLTILPVSGLVHVVKSGDTVTGIAKTYGSKVDEILAYNSLSGENDIYIGDILIVPGGIMPQKAPSPLYTQAPVANNFFIFPVEGIITQGLHWYNAVDTANKCGTPVHAAASGKVQRVKYGWNGGGGNVITVLHSNGIVTYYGHLQTMFVKPGDTVTTGDTIALVGGQPGMAGAGISTGCHLHFETIGAKNPLSKYLKGTKIKY